MTRISAAFLALAVLGASPAWAGTFYDVSIYDSSQEERGTITVEAGKPATETLPGKGGEVTYGIDVGTGDNPDVYISAQNDDGTLCEISLPFDAVSDGVWCVSEEIRLWIDDAPPEHMPAE